jgi:hypothetical protein
MDHIIQDINDLCPRNIYLRFADDFALRPRILSRARHGWREVAAALLCDVSPGYSAISSTSFPFAFLESHLFSSSLKRSDLHE